MPYNFSPSTLALLDDCPCCFWLHFRKNIRRPEGIFPSLPNGMDRIIKTHFDSFCDTGALPPEIAQLQGIQLFNDKELLKRWRNNLQGIQWTDTEGNVLRGAVDNILKKGDKLIVLDYKTRGYPPKQETQEYYRDQMDFYTFLLQKNGYDTEDYAYLLFYHPDRFNASGEVLFHADLVKISVDVGNARRIFQAALELLKQEKQPQPAKECEYCAWVKVRAG